MANKIQYRNAKFQPNTGDWVGIQAGQKINNTANLAKAIELLKNAQSLSPDIKDVNGWDGWKIQQFINSTLDKFNDTYDLKGKLGHIQEDGLVGNQTIEALNYVINALKDPNIPNSNGNKTYGEHGVAYIGNNGSSITSTPLSTPTGNIISNVNQNKTWENNKTLTPSSVGPTWNRKQIRNFSDAENVANSTISSINNVINPYGIKFKDNMMDLYKAVGNVGTRGGWDRARERALANRAYSITKGLDGKYFLKFNENRLNNKANNSYGYDISSLITSNQPTQSTQPIQSGAAQAPYSSTFNLPLPKVPNFNTDYKLFNTVINTQQAAPAGEVTGNNKNNNFTFEDYYNQLRTRPTSSKNGSKLNYMTQKYQQGGAAPQGDPQQQIIQLVQAAMQGDQQATAQIQQIMQAAQQGDQQAAQLAEMIMQVMNQMQGGAPEQGGAPVAARNGAKLNYIKKLKGECPEGYEMRYFKAGGKVCKKCQKKIEKNCGGGKPAKATCGTKFHRAGGVMEGILSEMFAKGGAMNRNKHTAFGEERGANVVSTNHAGRWGGRRAFNERGTHNLNPHDKPNKFTAFGDEGKKKPTNVGLVGHKATGKTGRMQNKQKAGVTYKATAFGGEKQKRFHRGAKASSIGRIGSINGYPKGQGGKSGIGRMSIGGSLNGVPFIREEIQ